MNEKKIRIAVCPGSFDPITNGHIDIIERATVLFDKVIVLISDNPDKKYTFSTAQRIDIVKTATKEYNNVKIDTLTGLLAEYMKKNGADVVIRGLRATSDFEYEFQMALANRELNANFETVFLSASLNHTYLSSSVVRQIGSLGGDIAPFVPKSALKKLKEKFRK